MTTISGTNGTTSTTTSSSLDKPTLDYDAFLKLLLAQMQNQDPMNPMDSTEYVSQLATFSNVEQGLKTNSKLDQLMVISNLTQATTMIGRTVTSSEGDVSGVVKSVRVDSSGAVAVLENGKEVAIDSGVTVAAG